MDERVVKLAKNLVKFSIKAKEGEKAEFYQYSINYTGNDNSTSRLTR